MIELLRNNIIPAALSLLPSKMDTPEARAILIAIALQESNLKHRRQVGGPALGLLQWELPQVGLVLRHPVVGPLARNVGEVDQICRRIEAMCETAGIELVRVSPLGKGAKLNAARFREVTGWTGRSNQHERDAAAVAWPYRRAIETRGGK